jgi:hypothetical protein
VKRWLVRVCVAYLALGIVVTAILLYPRYRDVTLPGLAFSIVAWPYMIFYAVGMNRNH